MKRHTILLLTGLLFLCGCGKVENQSESDEADQGSSYAESDASESEIPEITPEATPEPTKEPTPEPTPESTPEPTEEPIEEPASEPVDTTPQPVYFDDNWEFAANSIIHSGNAVLYRAEENRKNIVIGVNAGHGCSGGSSVYTYCHPDQTPKVTGGSTSAGSVQATACATGMTFFDGTPESQVTLEEAQILKEMLLKDGYDVLMIRDGEDVQLDNIARTLICNNNADCHIAIHWDGDGLDYDKGCFYMSVPDALKTMYPVSETWEKSNHLGDCLISGLSVENCVIFEQGSMQMDLTQTSYSKVPSIDIELGNAASDHSPATLENLAKGLLSGLDQYFSVE